LKERISEKQENKLLRLSGGKRRHPGISPSTSLGVSLTVPPTPCSTSVVICSQVAVNFVQTCFLMPGATKMQSPNNPLPPTSFGFWYAWLHRLHERSEFSCDQCSSINFKYSLCLSFCFVSRSLPQGKYLQLSQLCQHISVHPQFTNVSRNIGFDLRHIDTIARPAFTRTCRFCAIIFSSIQMVTVVILCAAVLVGVQTQLAQPDQTQEYVRIHIINGFAVFFFSKSLH
jgi:hypothetical protein